MTQVSATKRLMCSVVTDSAPVARLNLYSGWWAGLQAADGEQYDVEAVGCLVDSEALPTPRRRKRRWRDLDPKIGSRALIGCSPRSVSY